MHDASQSVQHAGIACGYQLNCVCAGCNCRQSDQDLQKELEKEAAKAAEQSIKEFEDKWKPIMDNVAEAEAAFEDLSGVMILLPAVTGLCFGV